MNSYVYGQLIFDRISRQCNGERIVFSTNIGIVLYCFAAAKQAHPIASAHPRNVLRPGWPKAVVSCWATRARPLTSVLVGCGSPPEGNGLGGDESPQLKES